VTTSRSSSAIALVDAARCCAVDVVVVAVAVSRVSSSSDRARATSVRDVVDGVVSLRQRVDRNITHARATHIGVSAVNRFILVFAQSLMKTHSHTHTRTPTLTGARLAEVLAPAASSCARALRGEHADCQLSTRASGIIMSSSTSFSFYCTRARSHSQTHVHVQQHARRQR
jgi:hypothetical protein